MAGMGDGYVGTAQDAVRIRRLEKQREAERRKIQELKNKTASSKGQPGLLQFGSSTSEILETAFKKETVGLVTREQYVEKRVNIKNKIEEEEKEKLLKLQQEEEELQLQKLKKRKIKADPRLSFADDFENDNEEEDEENNNEEFSRRKFGKYGKDPTVETSFLPDRCGILPFLFLYFYTAPFCNHMLLRIWFFPFESPSHAIPLFTYSWPLEFEAHSYSEREAEEQAERERLRKQWLREQEQIKNEPLEITYSYWDGTGHRRVIQVRKGDTIGEFLRAVQQQLAPEFREVRTASVENLLYVKEDLIIPHQHSFYELIVNKARGKSGPLFHFDVHEDVRTIADATIEKDESHAGKVVERHWYEKNKHIFPASRWEFLLSLSFGGSNTKEKMMSVRVFFILALLLFTSSVLQVARCEPDPDAEVVESADEGGDLGIVGEDVQDFGGGSFSPAPGVETICVFPKNPSKFVVAGEESELLVGIKNEGESSINVIAIQASVHLPFDHQYLVQNLSAQSGAFDLVGTIVYEIDQHPYQSTFYNGTIEVTEPGGLFSVESVFLFCLGVALFALLGFWIRNQIQQLSKASAANFKPVKEDIERKPRGPQRWKLDPTDGMSGCSSNQPSWVYTSAGAYVLEQRSEFPRNVGKWGEKISLCNADDKISKVVGTAHCADCKDFNFKIAHSFSGLHVTIDCKLKNGDVKRVAAGELDQQGNFNVPLPQDLVEDGRKTLKEECYAQLHSAAAVPCPAHNGLEASKIVFKSQANGITTFGPIKPLPPPVPIYKPKPPVIEPLPPPVPIYKPKPPVYNPPKKPCPPKQKPPVVKPLPPPVPVYKPKPPVIKPLPPPVPIYKPKPPVYIPPKKPCPPIKPNPPVYKPPVAKPIPPPVPIYKPPVVKPLPPPVPIYEPPVVKPLPPPTPIYKPPVVKPLPPPFYKKPCPPLPFPKLPPSPKIPPKYFHHPKSGYLPPLPPAIPHP
ncbi:UNVERIFIED_CONTAM: protein XAP5 CIRCADIAN TIMEKEEPER [Sesamum radiatum]|uniref:Protein XAP5 CIRCADIAN TIMEKEEPER n=1 Tax=Sesamum radiatum TaxID=300843 RepID=A0AAW2RUN2_SESRA